MANKQPPQQGVHGETAFSDFGFESVAGYSPGHHTIRGQNNYSSEEAPGWIAGEVPKSQNYKERKANKSSAVPIPKTWDRSGNSPDHGV
jgi:hypothetical protein